jgi:hypothetical protein
MVPVAKGPLLTVLMIANGLPKRSFETKTVTVTRVLLPSAVGEAV